MELEANDGAVPYRVGYGKIGREAKLNSADVGGGGGGGARNVGLAQPAREAGLTKLEAKLCLKAATENRGAVDLALPVGHGTMVGKEVYRALSGAFPPSGTTREGGPRGGG